MTEYLFNTDDPKQCGVGCDRLGTKKDGLKAKWIWYNQSKTPQQISIAKIGYFTLEAIFWHTNYEATLTWVGNDITSSPDKPRIITRIDAQKMAEKMLRDHYKYTKKILDKYNL